MKNECVICEAPLEYLDTDVVMECAICHKKEYSKIRCKNGHYVCNDCHMRGLNNIIGLCMKQTSDDPLEILDVMMAQPFSHMQGPEHHVMVGAALLTAYKNAGGEIDLRPALVEMMTLKLNAKIMDEIGALGGPRCCKRGSFISILNGIEFAEEHLGVEMKRSKVNCKFSQQNNQCIKSRCPFYKGE